jgi:TfoX/Sxy family transcriptional regulator of competence genes
MKIPPESFLIFKEELRKAKLEKEHLKKQYDDKLTVMNKELYRLKEQINSQQELIKSAMEYAIKLEENIDQFRNEVKANEKKSNGTFH